jgi:flagellar hook protein FlgE
MASSINTALSGYNAAIKSFNTVANNIANLTTPSFKPQQTVDSAQVTGGVVAQTKPVTHASVTVADSQSATGTTQQPNVDEGQQLVQANISSYNAKANVNIIKVDNENFKSLLDIIS